MKKYKAVSKEIGQSNEIIANTKSPGRFKGMSKKQFELAIKNYTCQNFILVEIL